MKRVSVCVLLAAITLSGRGITGQSSAPQGSTRSGSQVSNQISDPVRGEQAGDGQAPSRGLNDEQLAIYRAVLRGWIDDGKTAVYLSIRTRAYADGFGDSGNCEKGLDLGEVKPGAVHLFRQADLAKLGSDKVSLVDPRMQQQEVDRNDPGTAIRNGKPVDEAVRNGFAHGLVTLGEIRFDSSHTHAILWYGFVCGRLCGNGGTVLMEKTAGVWKKKSSCSQWIS